MFSHVTIGARDLERAGRFYDAVLAPLWLKRRVVTPVGGPAALCWVTAQAPLPHFYVYSPFNREPVTVGNGGMVAFLTPSKEAVSMAYAGGSHMAVRTKEAKGRIHVTGTAVCLP